MPRAVNDYDAGKLQGRNVGTANALSIVSPAIVTSGLRMSVDAGNYVSYPLTGSNWFDFTDNKIDQTLYNTPTFSNDGGGCIVFDGSTQYGSSASQTGFGGVDKTVDIWFKVVAFSSGGFNRPITLAGNSITDAPAMSLGYKTASTSFELGMGGSPYDCYIALSAINLDTWCNVVGSVVGNRLSAYINGAFYSSKTNSGFIESDVFIQLARYNGNYNQNANCKIASVKVYNRGLTSEEVNQNFNAARARFGI